jgi:hypothetical protein
MGQERGKMTMCGVKKSRVQGRLKGPWQCDRRCRVGGQERGKMTMRQA